MNKLMIFAACTIVMAGSLQGCSTTNPYSGEQQVSKATTGAAVGAATGALIGAVAGKGKGALIGAGAGALAGGAVGYYMDQQEAKLRAQLQGTGVSVTRIGDDIVLNMPGGITFQSDSADLRPDFFDVLNSVVLVLNEYSSTNIEVIGHTDSTGSADYNQRLSEKRAATVGGYLESAGVAQPRIRIIGLGESQPIATNDSAEGRQQNRRVELRLSPIVS